MHLKHQALAQEMTNRAETLGVERHCAIKNSFEPSFDIDSKGENFNNDSREEMRRWMLRYQLAKEPNREHIRALALLTPAAEDAAALMSGLRQIGQFKTALQVAK